ncbi:MAG: glycosyltransferase family 9 protein [Desulfobacterales bacterium]|nr:glycosyltransferase family 9 protein [Desulfobacterales bacterium]
MKPSVNIRNILIIRLSSIGDIILTTPVIKALKHKFPESKIDFLVMDKFKDAISQNSSIDNIIVFEKEKYKGIQGIINFSKTIKCNNYDLVIDLHAKIRSILISRLICKNILRYKKRALWKTILVKLKLINYHVDDTIIKNYFRPLNKLEIYYSGENLEFYFDETDLEKFKNFDNFIVAAPGAANETKKWPKEYFAELLTKFSENIFIIGGKNEFDECEYIKQSVGDRCTNFSGELSLKESGALLSKAKFVIANDSGPFHIARAVCPKSFVIFGPTDPNMFEFKDNATLIYANEKCAPCSLHGDKKCPKGHFNCMMKLTPEKVYAIINKNI